MGVVVEQGGLGMEEVGMGVVEVVVVCKRLVHLPLIYWGSTARGM